MNGAARRVLITGAAHGIGAATARVFAAGGDRVVVADIDDAAARAVADELGDSARAFHPRRRQLIGLGRPGRLDEGRSPAVIVNNAYRVEVAPAHELSESSWEAQLNVTLGGLYRSFRTFHAELTAARGAVVSVASVHALAGWPGRPAYAAAKGGILALTRQLAIDYGPYVRVNAVVPGPILTRAWDATPGDEQARVAEATALKRLGTPEEVASVIHFLAGPAAAYVTGTHVVVDGGQTSTRH